MTQRISSDIMREYLRVYLVIGSSNCRKDPIEVVEEALEAGVTLVQFREKGPRALQGEQMRALAIRMQAACRHAGVPFLVDDDVELALEIGADGVHIGQDDAAANSVRARMGDRILGVSAHTMKEAELAILQGADYLGIGPIYPTHSKADARAVQGTAIIQELRAGGIQHPLVGIGGITAERAEEVIRAGADGVAVISAITEAESTKEAVKRLLYAAK